MSTHTNLLFPHDGSWLHLRSTVHVSNAKIPQRPTIAISQPFWCDVTATSTSRWRRHTMPRRHRDAKTCTAEQADDAVSLLPGGIEARVRSMSESLAADHWLITPNRDW